jgi:hypothetical protein
MDDIKIIVWIVIGLIYLFSRRKKAAETPPPSRREEPEEEPTQPRSAPKSFEELLREIEGMKQPAPPPQPERRYQPVVDYDENIPEEEQDLEEIKPSYRSDDEIYKTYQKAKEQAFERPSLEETVKLSDTIVRFKQFKGYEKEASRTFLTDYLKELRDPQGFKKAFVMSEILKRKW